MRRLILAILALGTACSSNADTAVSWAEAFDINGTWELITGTVDGESIRPFLGITVTPDGIVAESNCNAFSMERDGTGGAEKLARCFGFDDAIDPMVVQEGFMDLVRAGPRFEDGLMVFRGDRGELVYERLPDYEPTNVFSVLADPERIVDASTIRRVRGKPAALLEHPATDASMYLSVSQSMLCTTWALDQPMGSSCADLRHFMRGARSWELTTSSGPTGIRLLVIPDAFVAAAGEALVGVAEGAGNLFLVDPTAQDQTITFATESGVPYTVTIGLG